MRKTVGFVLLLAVLLAACGQAPPPGVPTATGETLPPVTGDETGGAAIIYQRSGGIAGVAEGWTIYPDGRVVPAKGAEQRVPAEQVTALLAEIESLGFFDLRGPYGLGSGCADCFTYEIIVNSGGRAKSVTAVGEAQDTPAAFRQVVAAIGRLLAKVPQP